MRSLIGHLSVCSSTRFCIPLDCERHMTYVLQLHTAVVANCSVNTYLVVSSWYLRQKRTAIQQSHHPLDKIYARTWSSGRSDTRDLFQKKDLKRAARHGPMARPEPNIYPSSHLSLRDRNIRSSFRDLRAQLVNSACPACTKSYQWRPNYR